LARLLKTVGWRRIAVTALGLVGWRGLDQIPVPGRNPGIISSRLLGLEGGSLHTIGSSSLPFASYSIVLMGVGTYIYALAIMTAVRAISAQVRGMHASPEGRLSLARWTTAITVRLALGQAYGWTALVMYSQFPLLEPRLVVALELTAGTMILVLLAGVIDDHGIGFGFGAILLYALDPIAIEVHQLADRIASAPSAEALYLPIVIWLAFWVSAVVLALAFLLAVRRIEPAPSKKTRPHRPIELEVLMSGVLRPPIVASALLSVPIFYSEYLPASNPAARWIFEYWTASGRHAWSDVAFVALHALLVIGCAYLIVIVDFRPDRIPKLLMAHINRLTFAGAIVLAVVVVVLPAIERAAVEAAGFPVAMSGLNIAVVAALTVAVAAAAGRPAVRTAAITHVAPRML